MNNEAFRLLKFLNHSKQSHVAIFDIGTRAVRLLVAPAMVPQHWSDRHFFNAGQVSRLGADVFKFEHAVKMDQSQALGSIIKFIKSFKKVLLKKEVAQENIHAVGTAAFRWLKNSSEVLSYIEAHTNLAIRILSDEEEARIALGSIAFTHKQRNGPTIGEHDYIVLIDQGGGSTEISYSTPKGEKVTLFSFDKFGTIALQHEFFTLGLPERKDPAKNSQKIASQLQLLWQGIEETINSWQGHVELSGYKLHVYGMGSAITKCFPKLSNLKIHNKVCAIEKLKQVIHAQQNLQSSYESVSALWKRYKAQEHLIVHRKHDVLENQLLALCGLPVFVGLLEKLNVSELRISGYGLRYGYYLWKYHYSNEQK